MIIYLHEQVDSNIRLSMIVDNTKINTAVKSIAVSEAQRLQADLTHGIMIGHLEKCKCMSIGSTTPLHTI